MRVCPVFIVEHCDQDFTSWEALGTIHACRIQERRQWRLHLYHQESRRSSSSSICRRQGRCHERNEPSIREGTRDEAQYVGAEWGKA